MKVVQKVRFKKEFIVLVVLVLLLSTTLISFVYAWLTQTKIKESNHLQIGTVGVEVLANGTTITADTAYIVPTGSTRRKVNLKLRNTGDIDELVRVTLDLRLDDDSVPLLGAPMVMGSAVRVSMDTTGWDLNFPANNQVAGGDMYYSSVLVPFSTSNTNGEIDIIKEIVVPAGYENTPMTIRVSANAISYTGNIYKEIYKIKPSLVTKSSRPGDSRVYSTFALPTDEESLKNLFPSGTTDLIPVNAFLFGDTLPCDLTTSPKNGWTAWL